MDDKIGAKAGKLLPVPFPMHAATVGDRIRPTARICMRQYWVTNRKDLYGNDNHISTTTTTT